MLKAQQFATLQAFVEVFGLKDVARALLTIAEHERDKADPFPPITGSGKDDLEAIRHWSARRASDDCMRETYRTATVYPEAEDPAAAKFQPQTVRARANNIEAGHVWPFRPGYVGNDDGDICMETEPGSIQRWCRSGVIGVAHDGVQEAERYGWERRGVFENSVTMERR